MKETTTYPSILSESIRPYIQFVKNIRQKTVTCYNLLLKDDKMPFFKQFYTNTMALRKELNILQSKYHSNLFIFIFFHFGINPANYTASHKLIDNKLKSNMYPFPKDGYMLYNLIIDKKLKNVLELGCATGITSAYLLLAVKEIEGHVTSIDPNETTKWDSIGLHLIELMKLKTYHTFIEDPFYILAPTILLKEGENCIYDLVYINSYYTFDMSLTDIYFADKFVTSDVTLTRGGSGTFAATSTAALAPGGGNVLAAAKKLFPFQNQGCLIFPPNLQRQNMYGRKGKQRMTLI